MVLIEAGQRALSVFTYASISVITFFRWVKYFSLAKFETVQIYTTLVRWGSGERGRTHPQELRRPWRYLDIFICASLFVLCTIAFMRDPAGHLCHTSRCGHETLRTLPAFLISRGCDRAPPRTDNAASLPSPRRRTVLPKLSRLSCSLALSVHPSRIHYCRQTFIIWSLIFLLQYYLHYCTRVYTHFPLLHLTMQQSWAQLYATWSAKDSE